MNNYIPTVLSVVAISQSAAANARAKEAKITACKDLEAHFKGNESVELKKEYSSCIELLYPTPREPLSDNEIFAIKILIVACLLGGIGCVLYLKDYWDDMFDAFMLFILGALVTPVILGLIGGIFYTIGFVIGVV